MISLKKAKNIFYPGSKLDFRPVKFFIENTEVETFYYCDYQVFQNHSIEYIRDNILNQVRLIIEDGNAPEVQDQGVHIYDLEEIDFGDIEVGDCEEEERPNGIRDSLDYSVRYIGSQNPEIYQKQNWSEFFHENSGVNQQQIDMACIHVFSISNHYRNWKLIYFGTEAVNTYKILLNTISSLDVVVINEPNLASHWQRFSAGSMLEQLAYSIDKPPKFLLVEHGENEWKRYERANGCHNMTYRRYELNFNVYNYSYEILLMEFLRLSNVDKTKIHFIDKDLYDQPAIHLIKEGRSPELIAQNYRNSAQRKLYRKGEVSIGLVRVQPGKNLWLLFHVGVVKQDLNIFNDVGYRYKEVAKFQKYFNRLIVRYPLRRQSKIRKAEEIIDDLEVTHLIPSTFGTIDESLFNLICRSLNN